MEGLHAEGGTVDLSGESHRIPVGSGMYCERDLRNKAWRASSAGQGLGETNRVGGGVQVDPQKEPGFQSRGPRLPRLLQY